jgi:L-lactate dehydrogenase complex protein LldE
LEEKSLKKIKVGVHLPCYLREIKPQIGKMGVAVLRKLGEKYNFSVEVPREQTCCGQPFINSGLPTDLPQQTSKIFQKFDYLVSFGSSCVSTLRREPIEVAVKSYELSQFLVEKMGITGILSDFEAKIALHNSCHSLRHLRVGTPSELNLPFFNLVEKLLGIPVELPERDECCGFGGVYSLKEGELSYAMGLRKLEDLLRNSPEIVTGVDLSCLLHLEGIYLKEREKGNFPGKQVHFLHLAQLLYWRLIEGKRGIADDKAQ